MVAALDPQLHESAGDLADRGAELRVGDRIASRRRERGPRFAQVAQDFVALAERLADVPLGELGPFQAAAE